MTVRRWESSRDTRADHWTVGLSHVEVTDNLIESGFGQLAEPKPAWRCLKRLGEEKWKTLEDTFSESFVVKGSRTLELELDTEG